MDKWVYVDLINGMIVEIVNDLAKSILLLSAIANCKSASNTWNSALLC